MPRSLRAAERRALEGKKEEKGARGEGVRGTEVEQSWGQGWGLTREGKSTGL